MITIEIKRANKVGNDLSLFISFPFNQDVVNVMRELPCRYWHNDLKAWETPFKQLGYVLNRLDKFEIEIKADDAALFQSKKENPVDYKFKTKPFQHQIEGFNYGLTHDRWLLGDEQGLGKALALNTKVYTPTGFKLMKELNVGDLVFGKDGKPTRVSAVYDHHNVEMYEITFSDGATIECCKDHLWQIHDQHGVKVVDTAWFTKKDQFGRTRKDNLVSANSNVYKYWVDRCDPIQFDYQTIPIHPYVLGALLGDGSLTSNSIGFTTADAEMIDSINSKLRDGYILHSSPSMKNIEYNIVGKVGKVNTIKQDIIKLGLYKTNSHTKFIPDIYKYNSVEIRTQVLQGLLDTDGYASKDNLVQFTTVSKQLCEDVRFLVESLGGLISQSEKICGYNGKSTGVCYTLTIKFDEPQLYFTLTRKKSLVQPRTFKARRNIVAIKQIENADARCITVDNADHLYIIDHFVVTHNTKQVIDIALAKKQQRGYKHCLIVCGVNGLKWNWVHEILTHSDEQAFILGQKARRDGSIVIGSTKDKLADLELLKTDTDNIQPYFIITNIESLRESAIADTLAELCRNGIIGLVAADEIHKMRNVQSLQGKGFLKIQADTMIAMTGTPLMNTPIDLYLILKWLGYEDHTYHAFKNHYCVMGGYGNYQIVGYKHLDSLQEQLNGIMLRRLKEDVLDLPEKTYIDEFVEMTDKQQKIYKEVYSDIVDNIDIVKKAVNPLAEMIRLRQATGYTGILSSTIQESAKLDRMEELVEDAVQNRKKVVIFSNWTQMTDVIYSRLTTKGYSAGLITGNTKDEDRQNVVSAFQDTETNAQMHDREYKPMNVLIGTIGAMGTGLTLTAGTVEIFVDEPWTMAAKDQAVDRCHRIGQNSNLTIYTLLTKNTVDERIHEIVQNKGAMADQLVDGTVIGDKGALVDYLLS